MGSAGKCTNWSGMTRQGIKPCSEDLGMVRKKFPIKYLSDLSEGYLSVKHLFYTSVNTPIAAGIPTEHNDLLFSIGPKGREERQELFHRTERGGNNGGLRGGGELRGLPRFD